jgi:hypothetical protein
MQEDFQTALGANYWNDLRSELERLAKLVVNLEAARERVKAD